MILATNWQVSVTNSTYTTQLSPLFPESMVTLKFNDEIHTYTTTVPLWPVHYPRIVSSTYTPLTGPPSAKTYYQTTYTYQGHKILSATITGGSPFTVTINRRVVKFSIAMPPSRCIRVPPPTSFPDSDFHLGGLTSLGDPTDDTVVGPDAVYAVPKNWRKNTTKHVFTTLEYISSAAAHASTLLWRPTPQGVELLCWRRAQAPDTRQRDSYTIKVEQTTGSPPTYTSYPRAIGWGRRLVSHHNIFYLNNIGPPATNAGGWGSLDLSIGSSTVTASLVSGWTSVDPSNTIWCGVFKSIIDPSPSQAPSHSLPYYGRAWITHPICMAAGSSSLTDSPCSLRYNVALATYQDAIFQEAPPPTANVFSVAYARPEWSGIVQIHNAESDFFFFAPTDPPVILS